MSILNKDTPTKNKDFGYTPYPDEPAAQPHGRGEHADVSASELGGASLDRIRIIQTKLYDLKFTNCPQPIGILHGRDDHGGEYTILAPCKRWDCEVCGERNKNLLADRIRDGCIRIENDTTIPNTRRVIRFLTLTQHTLDPVPIMKAWNRFQAFLAKHGIDDRRYFLVKEFTKRGKRHLHILLNFHIKPTLLKRAWYYATERHSYIFKIKRVYGDIRSPAGYITKYLTKVRKGLYRKHEKRYTCDRKTDWSAYTIWKKPNIKWTFEFRPIWSSSMMARSAGEGEAEADSRGGLSPVGGANPCPPRLPGGQNSHESELPELLQLQL